MKNDVKTVKAQSGYLLQIELDDGRVGVFDVTPHLEHAGLAALRDPAYFGRVQVLYGAVTWPDGEDIAPDTLALGLAALATV